MFAIFFILAILAILGQACFVLKKQKEGFINDSSPITLFGNAANLQGLTHVVNNGTNITDDIAQYDVRLAPDNKQYFDIWQIAGKGPNSQKIKTYLNGGLSGGPSLMHSDNVTNISGFIIGCVKAVADADLSYGEISDTGCRGSNNLKDGNNLNTAIKIDNSSPDKGKLLTFDAKKLVDIIENPKDITNGNSMETVGSCSIVYDNSIDGWICASNCLIKKDDNDTGVRQGNINRGGDGSRGDLGDTEELYHMPLKRFIKHGDSYEFQCDTINSMYALPSGANTEPRKCEFGKLNNVQKYEQLKCGSATEVGKCQIITNINDVRCLPQTFTDDVTNKRYKYCKIVCTNDGSDQSAGVCQKDQDCAGHLHKHDVSDTVKQTPHKNPIAGVNDGLGYTRIEVDINGKPSNTNLDRNKEEIYGNLMAAQTMNPDGEYDVNVNVLEKTTISGLIDHVLNNMAVKDLKNFFTGVQSYFTSSPLELDEKTEWKNDHSNYGLSDDAMQNTPFTSAGGHLKISELADPKSFKNNNQYIARAREILYERKRSVLNSENRSLNPEAISKEILADLGKTDENIRNIAAKLENEYISIDKKRELRQSLLTEKDKKVNLINKIELSEANYDSMLNKDVLNEDGTPRQSTYYDIKSGVRKFLYKENGDPAFDKEDGLKGGMLGFKQNDSSYVPFKLSMPKYYRTKTGQYIETPKASTSF